MKIGTDLGGGKAQSRLEAEIARLDVRIDRLSMRVAELIELLDEHLQRHAG
jgi:hypothetical protein